MKHQPSMDKDIEGALKGLEEMARPSRVLVTRVGPSRVVFQARIKSLSTEEIANIKRSSLPDIVYIIENTAQDLWRSAGRAAYAATLSQRRALHSQAQVAAVFDFVALIVPRRLRAEDVGDALEEIERLRLLGAPRWHIALKTTSSVFWILVSAVREIGTALKGVRTSSGDK
jgi:hypothetical protein